MIFALDIGGTYTKYAQIENSRIIAKGKWETTNDLTQLLRNIDRVICRPAEFIGISIGGFWASDGSAIGYATLESTVKNSLTAILTEKYCCPAVIENDARCALLAEAEYGVLQGRHNAVLFVLGSSLGCAVQTGGMLFTGSTGQAGAMFMMPEQYDGSCYVFDETANSIRLTKAYNPSAESGDMLLLEKKALAGDKKAEELLEEYAKTVALKCWYAYLAYDPECIAFGGGIAKSRYIFEKIRSYTTHFFKQDASGRIPLLLRTKFGKDSNLLGAALLHQ